MKKLFLIVLLAQSIISSCTKNNIENWEIKVTGSIFSTPSIWNNSIYVGTEDGYFYRIDLKKGSILKESKIGSPIRSNALFVSNSVYVESLGQLYCLNANTLEQKFKVSPEGENVDMIDPWDYFHTSPVEYKGNIYFAGNKGRVYVINAENGSIIKQIITPEGAPIRSALTFEANNLYFGDNNGVIYEYNIQTEVFTMVYKTYETRPYSTYGYIVGGPFIRNGKLLFSNRHEKFTTLDLKSKSIAWTKSHDFSWWPAVPVVADNKVIIGGSDNLILAALSLETGETLWEYIVDYNNFCTPLVLGNALIMGTGDSYLNRKGDGSVFAVNLDDGKLINKYKPGGNVFSSPITSKNNTIICTTTGKIISIKNEYFTNPKPSKVNIDGDFNIVFDEDASSIAEKALKITISDEKAKNISFSVKTYSIVPDTLFKIKGVRDKVYAKGTHNVYLQANRGSLPAGDYKCELIAKLDDGAETIVKPFTISIKGKPIMDEPDFEVTELITDGKDGSAKFTLKANKQMNINISLVDAIKNDSIAGYFISQINAKWGIYRIEKDVYSTDYNRIARGNYKIVFEGNGIKKSFNFSKE